MKMVALVAFLISIALFSGVAWAIVPRDTKDNKVVSKSMGIILFFAILTLLIISSV